MEILEDEIREFIEGYHKTLALGDISDIMFPGNRNDIAVVCCMVQFGSRIYPGIIHLIWKSAGQIVNRELLSASQPIILNKVVELAGKITIMGRLGYFSQESFEIQIDL